MKLIVNKVFKTVGDKTAVSIKGDCFNMIKGATPELKESEYRTQRDGSKFRKFEFENATLYTTSKNDNGRWKTRCYVDSAVVEDLVDSENEMIIDHSAFDEDVEE